MDEKPKKLSCFPQYEAALHESPDPEFDGPVFSIEGSFATGEETDVRRRKTCFGFFFIVFGVGELFCSVLSVSSCAAVDRRRKQTNAQARSTFFSEECLKKKETLV